MAMKFYDPGELNLLNGTSCSGIQCLWYCFPWDVTPANVIVLTGLTSLGFRKDLLLTLCQTLAGLTRVFVLLLLVHDFCNCLSLSVSCFSISYSSHSVMPLPLPLPFPLVFFFYTYPSPCPLLSLLLRALPSSTEEPIEDRKACVSLAIHRCPSLSV